MEEEMDAAESQNPDPDPAKAQELKSSGNDKYNKNNFKGAIADYKKGLEYEQNNPDLHANLSAAYICLEKYVEAEEHAIFAISLKPRFHKGYMRAAKAAHGKGMTRIALKRLDQGLSMVNDPIGTQELERLKTQYTAFLSLPNNAKREMEFNSDQYESEDDDDDYIIDFDDDDDIDDSRDNPPAPDSDSESDETEMDLSCEDGEKEPMVMQESGTETVDVVLCGAGTSTQPKDNDTPLDKKSLTQKERKPFLALCKELTKDPDLKKHVAEFKEHLKNGSEAFLAGNYRKAVECYKAAKERVGRKLSDYEIDDRQYHVINYALSAALINHNTYDDVVKAIQGLTEMEVYRLSIPALYILMAQAYCKLNRFKTALEPLEKLQEIVDNFLIFPTFSWPGTTETIQETTPVGLKNAIKELKQVCRMQHKPTATCRFDNCVKISSHIVPSEFIYLSDLDFIGYVKMICEEKCHIEFHISCWKAYKESVCGIGKINDKDFIGRRCLTTDCVNSGGEPSQITTIEIIGPDGQVKSVNKHDPKISVETKKLKKKKCKIDDKEKVCKLEDKEKVTKQKKSKEKKVAREVKKPVTVSLEEEDESAEALRVGSDSVKTLESRKEALVELRELKFGLEENNYWNPQLKFYGRPDESIKPVIGQFLNPKEKKESDPFTDAKEFLFSYFLSILKDEGPLKQADVEDIWKQSAGDFCDIKVVLPDLKNISEVLGESTCFCLIEDYICLSEQIEEAYKTVKTEVVETATFLLTGSAEAQEETQEEETHSTHLQQNDHPPSDSDLLHSSSDDESEDGEENSGDESEESDEEMTEDEDNLQAVAERITEGLFTESAFTITEPITDERYSLQEMLKEMTRVKNMFMKATEEGEKKELDNNEERVRDKDESSSTETFESANSSDSTNMTTTDDLKNSAIKEIDLVEIDECQSTMESGISDNDKVLETAEMELRPSTSTDMDLNSDDIFYYEKDSGELVPMSTVSFEDLEDTHTAAEHESENTVNNNDKGSQSIIQTEERQIQTSPKVTTHKPSQTNDSELFKDYNKQINDFQNQISNLKKEINKLKADLAQKEASIKKIKSVHEVTITRLKDEHRSNIETHKVLNEKLKAQAAERESNLKQEFDELMKSKEKTTEMYSTLLVKYNQLKKELSSQQKSAAETKELLTTANATIKQLQTGNKTMEKNIKTKVSKAQQLHLQSIKAYWEREINQLRKRCVEKISEMQSWFSMFPPKEVEDLPSWGTIRQTTMQWGEVSKKVQEMEINFQIKYNELESKLIRGEELDELNTLTLPTLPEEPKPLPLDKIHKEITEKHLKKIGELTQLVVSQQLEIEKSKETNHQVQQLVNTFQMVPRMQTPMTTAFGSLALQYPYPQPSTTSFGQTLPTITPNQDTATAGTAAKILQADVQTLLKESSKAVSFTSAIGGKPDGVEDISFVSNFGNLSYSNSPAASSKSPTPPPVGVAHNLLKASTNLAEKKDSKAEERSWILKQDQGVSSRESTPAPSVAPTPDKPKKKKKTKSESKESAEVKILLPATHEPATVTNDASNEHPDDWAVVLPKNAWCTKPTISTTAPLPDTKLKNKKKLLDKLLLKFPTTNLKEMDEFVKQLREENNGSLSGLSFDEIEVRVGRIITKRHYMKSTTLGLVKFSDVAWVTVNHEEMISWTNLQNEDCSICLESMGQDRTKVNCNHEFHTKCLRKWLKEKSVCPLCNKFTTMPDEFPAL